MEMMKKIWNFGKLHWKKILFFGVLPLSILLIIFCFVYKRGSVANTLEDITKFLRTELKEEEKRIEIENKKNEEIKVDLKIQNEELKKEIVETETRIEEILVKAETNVTEVHTINNRQKELDAIIAEEEIELNKLQEARKGLAGVKRFTIKSH